MSPPGLVRCTGEGVINPNNLTIAGGRRRSVRSSDGTERTLRQALRPVDQTSITNLVSKISGRKMGRQDAVLHIGPSTELLLKSLAMSAAALSSHLHLKHRNQYHPDRGY